MQYIKQKKNYSKHINYAVNKQKIRKKTTYNHWPCIYNNKIHNVVIMIDNTF